MLETGILQPAWWSRNFESSIRCPFTLEVNASTKPRRLLKWLNLGTRKSQVVLEVPKFWSCVYSSINFAKELVHWVSNILMRITGRFDTLQFLKRGVLGQHHDNANLRIAMQPCTWWTSFKNFDECEFSCPFTCAWWNQPFYPLQP